MQPLEPTTDAEFERALSDLVNSAREQGLDVRGGWRVDGDGDHDPLSVEIVRLASPE